MLRKVGIKVDLRPYDEASIVGIVYRDHRFHITFERPFTAPDPGISVSRFYHSSFAATTIPYTNSAVGYNNSQVDMLLDEAASTFNIEKRKELYAQFQKIVTYDLPIIPLAEAPDISAYRVEVKNLHTWSAESRVERIDVWIQTATQVVTIMTPPHITTTISPLTSPPPQIGGMPIGVITALITVSIIAIAIVMYYIRKR